MATYFTADTHFGHAGIIKHCRRPYDSVSEMDADLISNWNDKVGDRDTIYHLGDFAFGRRQIEHIVPRLKGKIILLPGNHDQNDLHTLKHLGIEIREPHFYKQDRVKIWMSHYAHMVWPDMHKGSRHLYGHSHGNVEKHTKGLCFDIGVDCTDYSPLSFDEVMTRFSLMDHGETFKSHMSASDIKAEEWYRFASYFK